MLINPMLWRRQLPDCSDSSCGCQRMAIVSARNQHPLRNVRVDEVIHISTLPADHAHGIAVSHGFAEGRQIRSDLTNALVSRKGMAEPGLYFVKYQETTILVGHTSQCFQISRQRFDYADILQNWFQEDARSRIT